MFSKSSRDVLMATCLLILGLFCIPTTQAQEKVKFTAQYKIQQGTDHGWIILQAEIPVGSHIYSLTQKGTPPPTKIKVAESEQFSLIRKFKADKKPIVVEMDPIFESRVEKHDGKVKFLAPIHVGNGVNVEGLKIDLKFHGQQCFDTGCIPLFNKPVQVDFGGYYLPTDKKIDQ